MKKFITYSLAVLSLMGGGDLLRQVPGHASGQQD